MNCMTRNKQCLCYYMRFWHFIFPGLKRCSHRIFKYGEIGASHLLFEKMKPVGDTFGKVCSFFPLHKVVPGVGTCIG